MLILLPPSAFYGVNIEGLTRMRLQCSTFDVIASLTKAITATRMGWSVAKFSAAAIRT